MALIGNILLASGPQTNGVQLIVDVTYTLAHEGDVWVATCADLGASSFGDTPEEAQEALSEAEDGGYLTAYLRDRNVRVRSIGGGHRAERWAPLEPVTPL